MEAKELAVLTARVAEENKAEDVVILGLEGKSIVSDYLVLCSGRNTKQVQAIADHIQDTIPEPLNHREGGNKANWVLLDYGEIIVHVFREEERKFYNLERLWGDSNDILRAAGHLALTPQPFSVIVSARLGS